ncbi:hypothetical protein M8C21_025213, partial [Ambrosia artemisiifolia]
MFCVAMIDIANEFEVPTYTYFTAGAATLNLMFYLQAKRDEENYDVTELKNSESGYELQVPGFVNPVPCKVLPEVALDKEGGSKMFLDIAKRFRESKGIIVNTFQALESHPLEYLPSSSNDIPPVFVVGPILNLEKKNLNDSKTDDILSWLNKQPESSVVFLCFGSMGSFNEKQVKKIAIALERSGHRFLWSLRRPAQKEKFDFPKEYEHFEEVLPEGFLARTSGVGKVIGWAPQIAVIWCGVPMAAWPLYAEQQLNAFQLVVELGIAAEIRMDYQMDTIGGGGSGMMVTVEEIEEGIRKLMSDGEMRKKVKDMKDKSRAAVVEGGSSHATIGKFIDHVM